MKTASLAALTWLAIALFMLMAGSLTAQNSGLSLEDQRQVEALTEQIRMLHTEGRYNEVVQTANRLLTIDPSNAAGVIWRDRAQTRIAGPLPQPDRLIELREPPERSRGLPLVDVSAADTADFTPVPLQPRARQTVIATPTGLPQWLVYAVIALVVIVLILAIFLVLRMRASQRQVETRVADVVTRADQTAYGTTGLHDEVTRAPSLRDEDSVMQFGEVGRGSNASDDDTAPPPIPPRKPEPKEDEQTLVELEQFGDDHNVEAEDDSISLDFGDDKKKEDTGFNSLMFDDVEESKGSQQSDDDNEKTFNSMMFGEAEETKVPSAPPAEAAEGDEQTFNSMMFGGEETNVGEPKKEQDISLGESIDLSPGLDGDPEETNILGSSQTGVQRFEHQKSVGVQALASGDYKLAVQALTLAQALKPEDDEVNEKLEEAKKLRDQG